MKTSFYFTLWGFAFFVLDVLNISALEKFNFIIAFVFVLIASWLVNKFCANEIFYQDCCKLQVEFELVYSNDVKKFKRKKLQDALIALFIFTYILALFICLFVAFTDVPIWDYLIWGVFVALSGISLFYEAKDYYEIRNTDKVIFPYYGKELLEMCEEYCEARKTYSYEELSPEPTSLTKIMNVANVVFAVLSVSLGLLVLFQFIPLIFEINDSVSALAGYSIYGSLAIYFGAKDLLSVTTQGNKYLLLLSSFLLVLLLYNPIANFYNKEVLKRFIGNKDDFIYVAGINEVQDTVKIDENEWEDINKDIQSYKDLFIFGLQVESLKPLCKIITRIDAGYRVIFKTKKTGKQIDFYISPNEIEACYDIKLSAMEVLLKVLYLGYKINVDDCSTKTYDDGKCLVVELSYNKGIEPIDDKVKYMKILKSDVRDGAKDYKSDLISLNRGFKIRDIYKTGQIFEASLSLEEIKQIKVDTETKDSKK